MTPQEAQKLVDLMNALVPQDLTEKVLAVVDEVEPASGPQFAHEHTCDQCGQICLCDWAGCDPSTPGTCQACIDWQEGRA